jgi:hypothetical protein
MALLAMMRRLSVSFAYQPKYSKARLRDIVTRYIGVMRTLGHQPNCSVAFDVGGEHYGPSQVRGWLLKDTRPDNAGSRYVLLEDGDVWREVEATKSLPDEAEGLRVWLNCPDDGLVTLLMRSQASARLNGDPFFESEEHVDLIERVVADRRLEHEPFRDPERRARNETDSVDNARSSGV